MENRTNHGAEIPVTAPTPSGGDAADAIAYLRAYCAPDHWKPFAESDDYQLFGSLYLSDLRNALAAFDAALLAARRGVEREAEVIAAARRFVECSVRADRTPYIKENGRHGSSPWAELVEAIGNLDRALAATPKPR